ncbi:MAG: nicotinate-nucleotide adenylyltransferase [Candidatus Omnitrophica bacterium]|nr:nicotinate-nucleotide adenylyltransferase [Candidatus Omnitrophota bacterium]
MRIGILGGTFNPVHKAHLKIAQTALKKICLDKVLFVPAYKPPHKAIEGKTPTKDRVSMLRLALKGYKKFSVCLFEINKKGTSYTIDTLKHLKKRYPKNTELFFLFGSDQKERFHTWKDHKKLLKLATFVAFKRPCSNKKKNEEFVQNISFKPMDISSKEVRKLIHKKKSTSKQVPKTVINYISQKQLY